MCLRVERTRIRPRIPYTHNMHVCMLFKCVRLYFFFRSTNAIISSKLLSSASRWISRCDHTSKLHSYECSRKHISVWAVYQDQTNHRRVCTLIILTPFLWYYHHTFSHCQKLNCLVCSLVYSFICFLILCFCFLFFFVFLHW